MITLDEQIKCVKREIALRERVYPKHVARKLLSQHSADEEIARMKAVLATLLSLEKLGERIEGVHA